MREADAPLLFTDAMKYWIGAHALAHRDSAGSWNEEIANSEAFKLLSHLNSRAPVHAVRDDVAVSSLSMLSLIL